MCLAKSQNIHVQGSLRKGAADANATPFLRSHVWFIGIHQYSHLDVWLLPQIGTSNLSGLSVPTIGNQVLRFIFGRKFQFPTFRCEAWSCPESRVVENLEDPSKSIAQRFVGGWMLIGEKWVFPKIMVPANHEF